MNKSKAKNGGILGGIILLLAGIAILWNNEGRTVNTQSAILEAKNKFIQVKSDKINSKNDGKLVATKGKIDISTSNDLKDEIYGITQKAVKMKRNVEIYQWKENCETDDNDNKKCTYEKVWDNKLLDSSEYDESGHDNPTEKKVEDEEYIADNVKLGAYVLPEELIKDLKYNKKKSEQEIISEYNNLKEDVKVNGKYLTNVKDDMPQIGDYRISYEYAIPKSASVIAVQTDDTFEAFTSKKGKDIYRIVEGNKTGIQILEDMTRSNNNIKWFLRILGTVLVIFGFSSMFSLITTLTDKIPLLGNIASGLTSVVSSILGISISLLVIAIAWFRFRPILSIILIGIIVILLLFLKIYLPKNQKKNKPV